MQRKFLIRAALVLLLILGSFFVLWSSARATAKKKETCRETIEECSQKRNKTSPSGEMIWETLSHQFFSATEISR